MSNKNLADEAERDVLAAIGRWAVEHVLRHRAELANQMFDDVAPQFNGRYPHHKLLSHLWQELREPKDMSDVPKEPPALLTDGGRDPKPAD